MRKPLKVGDRVAYTQRFLRSVGAPYDIAMLQGRVLALEPFCDRVLATVEWVGEDTTSKILTVNICRTNSVEFIDT